MREIEKQMLNYLAWCQNYRGYTKQTLNSKYYSLKLFKEWLCEELHISNAENITNEHLNIWVQKMKNGEITGQKCNNNTLRKYITIIRVFIEFLQKTEQISKNNFNATYVRNLKPQPVRKNFFLRWQIDRVLRSCELKTGLMIALCFESGFRLNELLNIKPVDIYVENNCIFVIGKGEKPANVEVLPFLIAKLNEFIKDRNIKPNDRIFPYSKNTARLRMKKAFAQAGFNIFTAHDLRHSFATDLALNGAKIETIMSLLRHEDIKTTQKYIHEILEFKKQEYILVKSSSILNSRKIKEKSENKFSSNELALTY